MFTLIGIVSSVSSLEDTDIGKVLLVLSVDAQFLYFFDKFVF